MGSGQPAVRYVLFGLIAVVAAVVVVFALVSTQAQEDISWFCGKASHGLSQDRNGGIKLTGTKSMFERSLVNAPDKLYAAVYYGKQGVLTTVTRDATVSLYRNDGHGLALRRTERIAPSKMQHYGPNSGHIVVGNVRFTRVPGLIYIRTTPAPVQKTASNRREIASVACLVQVSYDECRRLALLPSAKKWYGIAIAEGPRGYDDKQPMLEGCYRLDRPDQITLSMAAGKSVALKLPEPLHSERICEMPPEDLRVAVVSGHGIVCNTRHGLSLHRLDGSLVRQFKVKDWRGQLDTAYYRGGKFIVDLLPGRENFVCALDVAKGRLIDVTSNRRGRALTSL